MNIVGNKLNPKYTVALIVVFIVLAAASRLVTDGLNFAPIGALALFSGAMMTNRKWAFILPIGGVLLSDIAIELITPGSGFYPGQQYVYASYLIIVALGFLLRFNKNPIRVLGLAISGSLLFFAITNFGMWAGSGMYEHTFAGLIECYAMAIPFFRNTFMSDLLFSALFFGSYYLISSRQKQEVKA